MKQYNMTCPLCGKTNEGLFLDETDGWMECIACGSVVRFFDRQPKKVIPLVDGAALSGLFVTPLSLQKVRSPSVI